MTDNLLIPQSLVVPRREPRPSEGPPPGLIEGIAASFRTTEDEVSNVQEKRKFDGYQELEDTLIGLGHDRKALRHRPTPLFGLIPIETPATRWTPDTDAIWQAVEAERKRDPKAFAAIPKTQKEYETWLYSRRGERAQDERTAARSGTVANLAGGLAGSFTDPINVLTLPFGGGKTVVQTALREGAINAGLELAQTPDLIRNRERMGEETSARDAATNVLFAALGGALLGGASKGVELLGRSIAVGVEGRLQSATDVAVEGIYKALPDKLKKRWASAAEITPADLPDLAEAVIGRGNMTPAERGAIDALRADGEMAAANPFKPNGAGIALHQQLTGSALEQILTPLPEGTARFVGTGLPARPDTPGSLRSGTSLSIGGSGIAPGRDVLKARIAHVEAGGSNTAKNPMSSATGKYQFTSGTWLSYYKQRFGSGGLSDAQILAKRGDGRLQDVLVDDLIDDNTAMLKSIGEAPSAGNLYLAHFAGPAGARKLFAADPNASARSVLGDAVVNANGFLEGMNAREVIAWAHRKMGENPPARAGSRAELRDDIDVEAQYRDQLQADIDRLQAETDALYSTLDPEAEARVAAAAEADPVIVETGDALPAIDPAARPREPVAEVAGQAMDAETLALLPSLRAIIADREARPSLSTENLARLMNTSPERARVALERLAELGDGVRMTKQGIVRKPMSDGPVDAVEFIARNGGLRDNEGHALGLKGVGKKAEKEMTRGAKRNAIARRAAAGKRDLQRFIPGVGPLLRTQGLSIDRAGELLWDAGYFAQRPSVAEVLDMLDRSTAGERFLTLSDTGVEGGGARAADAIDEEEFARWEDSMERAWEFLEFDEPSDALKRALFTEAVLKGKADETMLFGELADRNAEDVLHDLMAADDRFPAALVERDYRDAADGQRAQADEGGADPSQGRGGDAGEGAAGAGSRYDRPPDTGDAGPAVADGFADPNGPAAKAQVDSLDHDIRMAAGVAEDAAPAQADAFGGATATDKRVALERAGEGRIKGHVAQKAPGSDGGLFDAQARDIEFRFGEDDSDTRTLRQVFDDLDAEQSEIDEIRSCLK